MLRITVIAVGKLKERFWKDACAEYLKRLGAYAKVAVKELPDSTPEQEEKLILAALGALPQGTHTALLDIGGDLVSSEELAVRLDRLALGGTSNVAFIIGGSDGVTEAVRARADERISFGRITLPHNLARVVLLEQLYRSRKISAGEPYHK
ncbi:MAG: 23S rRNA (pseudouridine(1915)-N(3))-methyltransferase RlmH [Olegusella sp.]|nr:23S rRNA (pseudouridine(1915)-N(3))-methyltransferase RlmH [Olegusella sp.]